MKRSGGLKRGRPRPRPSLKTFWEAVTENGTAPCWLCAQGRGGPCGGKLDAHHWIEQQAVRSVYATRVYNSSSWEEQQGLADELDRALADPRNGSPVRRQHHAQLTDHRIVVARSQLPEQVEEFAAEHELGWWLDRTFGLCEVRAVKAVEPSPVPSAPGGPSEEMRLTAREAEAVSAALGALSTFSLPAWVDREVLAQAREKLRGADPVSPGEGEVERFTAKQIMDAVNDDEDASPLGPKFWRALAGSPPLGAEEER